MAHKEIFFLLESSEAAVRFWRNRATKLEAEVAELKAALARRKAFEAGEAVPSIVRARKRVTKGPPQRAR